MNGKMIVICAPSGTGKSTLLNRLKQEHPELEWSVSCTTRPMRPGEVEGKDYHFLKVEDFKQQIYKGLFIEWAQVHSNYYGTSRKFVDEGLLAGKKMLFDLDVQAAWVWIGGLFLQDFCFYCYHRSSHRQEERCAVQRRGP